MAVKGLSPCVYTVITKTRSGRIFQASVVKTLGSLCVFTQSKKLGYLTDVQNIIAKRLSYCVYTVITKTRSGRIFQASAVKTLCSLCVFTQGKKLGYLTDVRNITKVKRSVDDVVTIHVQ